MKTSEKIVRVIFAILVMMLLVAIAGIATVDSGEVIQDNKEDKTINDNNVPMNETKENSKMTKKKLTGAENVRWDLSYMYAGIDDPQIEKDLAEFEKMCVAFRDNYRGQLDTKLEGAITGYITLDLLSNKFAFFFLSFSTDTKDDEIKSKKSILNEKLSRIGSEYLTFFTLEVAKLTDETIDRQATESEILRHNRPFLKDILRFKDYQLSEEVETALGKRSPFGAGSWSSFHSETESALRFEWKGEEKNLTEMLKILSSDPDADTRATALKLINDGFKGTFADFSAYALYITSGAKRVSDSERGYAHPMASRNLGNQIDDEIVNALHTAVKAEAAPLAQRFYRMKANRLGMKTLKWSDRNAEINFGKPPFFPYDEGKAILLEAVDSFSPTMGKLSREIFDGNFVDAPVGPNKRGGAYCANIPIPGKTLPYIMLNYQGKPSDVATMAHEFGHGVHALLAYEAQGVLTWNAPMAYAETASVFNEMITNRHLQEKLKAAGNDEARLSLAMAFADDIINTVVRQISFSEFERMLHKSQQRLSVEEMNTNWMQVTEDFYGKPGDVFTYEDTEYMWTYISHFYRPFYVYSYAVGQLLTASLFAAKDDVENFEEKYLDMLRAGGTKDMVELLKPFGLDPTDPQFWSNGIKASLGETVELAEKLTAKLDTKK